MDGHGPTLHTGDSAPRDRGPHPRSWRVRRRAGGRTHLPPSLQLSGASVTRFPHCEGPERCAELSGLWHSETPPPAPSSLRIHPLLTAGLRQPLAAWSPHIGHPLTIFPERQTQPYSARRRNGGPKMAVCLRSQTSKGQRQAGAQTPGGQGQGPLT